MSNFHSFNIELAQKYGIEESVLIEHFKFWTKYYQSNHDKALESNHYHDDNYWFYNSVAAWEKQYPYLTPARIKRALTNLETLKIIKTGNFNKNSYDRTKWYCYIGLMDNEIPLADKNIPLAKLANGKIENSQPIPITNPIANSVTNSINIIIDYYCQKTDRPKTTNKIIIKNITEVLKSYSIDDCKKVIDFIIVDKWYKDNGYDTLSSIFKPTKFHEKFERALVYKIIQPEGVFKQEDYSNEKIIESFGRLPNYENLPF